MLSYCQNTFLNSLDKYFDRFPKKGHGIENRWIDLCTYNIKFVRILELGYNLKKKKWKTIFSL